MIDSANCGIYRMRSDRERHGLKSNLAYRIKLENINRYSCGLVGTVFGDELVEVLLSSSRSNDEDAVLNEFFCKSSTNARSGSDEKNFVIGQSHGCDLGCRVAVGQVRER